MKILSERHNADMSGLVQSGKILADLPKGDGTL